MQLALEKAGIRPGEVDYLNAHATSTIPGDLSKLKAIETVIGTAPELSVSATKSITGHLLGRCRGHRIHRLCEVCSGKLNSADR